MTLSLTHSDSQSVVSEPTFDFSVLRALHAQLSYTHIKVIGHMYMWPMTFLTIDRKDEETWYDQQDIDKDKGIGSDLVFTFKEDVKKIG